MMRSTVMMSLILCLQAQLPSHAADAESNPAQATYQQAQTLKRANRFSQARTLFESITAMPESAPWTQLAADELRFGLPLHESQVLVARLTSEADSKKRAALVGQLDSLYSRLINENADKPERIAEVERKRDQLALLRQTTNRDETEQLKNGLVKLREQLEKDRKKTGRWPDRNGLAAAVAGMLGNAGLAADHLSLFDYYPTSNSFYATFRDATGKSEVKIKGDGTRVRIEGAGL